MEKKSNGLLRCVAGSVKSIFSRNRSMEHESRRTGGQGEKLPQETVFYMPVRGEVLPVSQAADPAFASGGLGEGVAINPADGMVYAPCDGMVDLVFPSRHALRLTSDTGVELLIHVGMNTVDLGGEGFRSFVNQGTPVKRGDRLLQADLEFIRSRGLNPQIVLLLPGGDHAAELFPSPMADAEDRVMVVKKYVKNQPGISWE